MDISETWNFIQNEVKQILYNYLLDSNDALGDGQIENAKPRKVSIPYLIVNFHLID